MKTPAQAAYEIIEKFPQYKTAKDYCRGFMPLYDDIIEKTPESNRSLDIGCAYGMLSLMLRARGDEVVGADMTKKFTSLPMFKDQGIRFELVDLEKDKELPGGFDLVMLTEVLEHLNSNPLPSIKKIYDALNKGGSAVCTTPAKELHGDTTSMNQSFRGQQKGLWNDLESWRDIPEYTGPWKDQHTFHYDQFDLVDLFTEAGFVIDAVEIIQNFSHLVVARKP